MSLAADSNIAMRATDVTISGESGGPATAGISDAAVEQALAAAVADAGRIGDLLEALRGARLWLPLPDDGRPPVTAGAVTLPTVSYLGSEFVPAYSSARLLQQFARTEPLSPPAASSAGTAADQPSPAPVPGQSQEPVPYVVVRAADLARLLPPAIGIALNAGAAESVPVYPPGVSFLAAPDSEDDLAGLTVGPLPVRPDGLLAGIAAGLIGIEGVRGAVAAWLSVESAGEGLLIAVTLDNAADAATRDLVVGAVERAAWEVEPEDAAFPIDVTFPGEREADRMDERIAAVGTPFYRRG